MPGLFYFRVMTAEYTFKYASYNGNLCDNDEPIIRADNRGFKYGDGLFETLRFVNGKVHLMDLHMDRLFKGLQLLEFELPEEPEAFTPAYIQESINILCRKNGHKVARVRITVFRGDGGLYDPEDHFPNCIIQSWPLPEAGFQLNENGLVTGFYLHARKTMDMFSNLKNNNYLPYVMAALQATKQGWDDAFLLNTNGGVCDATIANIFIIKDETIYTCPLEEGCVAGVMRRFLIDTLPAHGFRVIEKNLSQEDVLAADEIFLTNAIKGIRWVERCGESSYTNRLSTAIFNKLLRK